MMVIETGGKCDCIDAEDFLNKLSPRDDFWKAGPSAWMFRGQDGDWPLLPKAYRTNGKAYRDLGIDCDIGSDPAEHWVTYQRAQRKLLTRFRELLDKSDLDIPLRPPDLYDQGEYSRIGGDPDPKAFPQQALAQHLGLPTPLLDWTTRGLVGAYFAVPKKPTTEPKIVVWALRRDFLRSGYGHDENYVDVSDHFSIGNSWIKIETAPRSSNPNLHAQAGLFTLVRGEDAHVLPVDKYVEQLIADKPERLDGYGEPLMRKVTLPSSCGPTLLRLLADEGIDASTMFPGYDGIAKALAERALWPK